jgi:hypothetical protein
MCVGEWLCAALGAGLALLAAGAPVARADFLIVAHEARVDELHRQTTFKLVFNQPPDFFTADEFGRPKNEFQYFYNSDGRNCDQDMGKNVVVIRGGEIRFDREIPIRESENPTGDGPVRAGGWGPERGAVAFESFGDEVQFTVPWKTLGETDGHFCYQAMALEYGSLTSDVSAVVIPVPAGWALGVVGLGGLGAWMRFKPRG